MDRTHEYLTHTTSDGVQIYCQQGKKSPNDFIVRYLQPDKKRRRTPKHIHFVVDLYIKRAHEPYLTHQLLNHIVDNICSKVKPSTSQPPTLKIYSHECLKSFTKLNAFGDYSVEFLLVTIELIQTQEKTNYPDGIGHIDLYERLRSSKDIFSVVGAATFR